MAQFAANRAYRRHFALCSSSSSVALPSPQPQNFLNALQCADKRFVHRLATRAAFAIYVLYFFFCITFGIGRWQFSSLLPDLIKNNMPFFFIDYTKFCRSLVYTGDFPFFLHIVGNLFRVQISSFYSPQMTSYDK